MIGYEFQQKRGTSAQWAAADPILLDGQLGIDKDTGVIKVGDGVKKWSQLSTALGSQYLPVLGKAADSDKLDGHDSTEFLLQTDPTSVNTPNTVVKRDVNGAFSASKITGLQNPTQTDGAAPKSYVDALGYSASTVSSVVRRDGSAISYFGEARVTSMSDPSSATRKDYVDGIGTSASTASALVRRDASDTFGVGYVNLDFAPSQVYHATRKDYVDAFFQAGMITGTGVLPSVASSTTVWTVVTGLSVAGSLKGQVTFDLTTGKVIIGKAGTYAVSGGYNFGSNATGRRQGSIYRNGVQIPAAQAAYGAAATQVIMAIPTTLVDLAVGDYLQLAVMQDSGASLGMTGSLCSVSAVRVA